MDLTKSPSVWREWIEILCRMALVSCLMSPSVWREWIEMSLYCRVSAFLLSPSVWREWIEIDYIKSIDYSNYVSLRVEGVD